MPMASPFLTGLIMRAPRPDVQAQEWNIHPSRMSLGDPPSWVCVCSTTTLQQDTSC